VTERTLARWREFAVEAIIRVTGFSTIGLVVVIFAFLLREGVPFFFQVELGNVAGVLWYPTFGLFGALPLLLGRLLRHDCGCPACA